MSTALELINDAAKATGKLGPGRSLSQSEAGEGFRALVRMIDAWTIQRLTIYSITRSTFTITPGLSPHTIGTGGTWNVPRPVRIQRMGLVIPGTSPAVERPLKMLTDDEWAQKRVKVLPAAIALEVWYNEGWPLGQLFFWPVPQVAQDVALYHWERLVAPTAQSDQMAFPPGYEEAIITNLALRMCPVLGVAPRPDLLMLAEESLGNIKRFNMPDIVLGCDSALVDSEPRGGGLADFYAGR